MPDIVAQRHTGEGRYPGQPWVAACAGTTESIAASIWIYPLSLECARRQRRGFKPTRIGKLFGERSIIAVEATGLAGGALEPVEHLGGRVDLVVVLAVGEGGQFGDVWREPRCPSSARCARSAAAIRPAGSAGTTPP